MAQQSAITSFFGGGAKDVSKPAPKKRKILRKNGSHFGLCPLCARSYPLYKLEQHASSCNGQIIAIKEDEQETKESQLCFLTHHREPIPGLFVFDNFITQEEEAQILAELDNNDETSSSSFLSWRPANFNGLHFGKRWGVHCNLRDRKVSEPENPLPPFMKSILLPALAKIRPMANIQPNEANAIDYRRKLGHYLSAHVDDRRLSKEPIANLSLAGDCYMTFTNVAPQRNTAVASAKVWLPRRCLQVLTGRARYDFSHGIDNADLVSDRRVSMTMRESPLTVNVLQKLQNAAATTPKVPRPVMAILDPIQPTQEPIPGLFLFENFISAQEEQSILEEIDRPDVPWRNEKHSGRHNEKRWGVEHDLWSRHVRPPQRDLPHFMNEIILPKLGRIAAMQGCMPNEVNSIEYRRKEGHSLNDHVDDRQKSKEPIANLSLAGECLMTYRNEKNKTAVEVRRVLLKRCCLQIMTGQARYDFTHGIENKDLLSDRRVSVTMREIKY
eukprot:scaffold2804_cov181-Amphora_coffeaeformis.AAC.20